MTASPYPKIFIYVASGMGLHESDVVGYAIAEDGSALKAHMSSSMELLRRDMGLQHPWFADHYEAHYPEGYDLVDLTALSDDQLHAHEGLAAALALNAIIPEPTP